MHGEGSFVPLLIVVTAALATGALVSRLPLVRVPVVVGEILVGILVGKSGFEVIPAEPDPWLELLSMFGFTFLMFLSGLEIDFHSLQISPADEPGEGKANGNLKRLLTATFGVFGTTLVLSLLLSEGMVLAGYLDSPYIMALIMGTTSVGLVMPLLKERGEAGSPFGQVVILTSVVADFTTMLLITVVVAVYQYGRLTQDVLVVGTLFILFFGILWAGKRLLQREQSLVKHLAFTAPRTAQLKVRAAFTLMLVFVVFSQIIGSEIILGAFLAGAVVSALAPRAAHGLLGIKLEAIGFGFFIPIFFIMVGARFDIGALVANPANLALVPLLVAFAFVVKVIPSLLLSRFFGRRNAIAAGFLISSRLSLIIAASEIGLRLGVIDEAINSAIILVAIISCVVSPIVYGKLRKTDRKEQDMPKRVDLDPLLGELIHKKRPRNLELQMVGLEARRFPFLVGRTLAEARLRQETGMTLIEVIREDGSVTDNPGPDMTIQEGDALFLIGSTEQVGQAERWIEAEKRMSAMPQPPTPGAEGDRSKT